MGTWVSQFGLPHKILCRTTITLLRLFRCETAVVAKGVVEGARPPALAHRRWWPSRQSAAKNTIRNSAPRLEIPTKTISGIRPISAAQTSKAFLCAGSIGFRRA